MKLLFHLRSDADKKPGGDYTLLKNFKTVMENRGHLVDVTFQPSCPSSEYDAALTFNLDRPLEPLIFVNQCVNYGIPVLLYSLHHPTNGINEYLKFGVTGIRKLFAFISGYKADRYEAVLSIIKSFRLFPPIHILSVIKNFSTLPIQRSLLHAVDGILVSSEGELLSIKSEIYKNFKSSFIVPHMFESSTNLLANESKEWDVVCAARIESRKNQLQVAELIQSLPDFKFLFVGSSSPTENQYFNHVKSIIDNSKNAHHIASVNVDELRSIFTKSKIFVSLSWFEVVSLTELEAYSAGCTMVVGKNSYLKEYVSDDVHFIDPSSSLSTIKETILNASSSNVDYCTRSKWLGSSKFQSMSSDFVGEALESCFKGIIK